MVSARQLFHLSDLKNREWQEDKEGKDRQSNSEIKEFARSYAFQFFSVKIKFDQDLVYGLCHVVSLSRI